VDDRPHAGKVRDITSRKQGNRQDVMSEHLPVVVSSFFAVDHVYLVKPPSELSEVVEFGRER